MEFDARVDGSGFDYYKISILPLYFVSFSFGLPEFTIASYNIDETQRERENAYSIFGIFK